MKNSHTVNILLHCTELPGASFDGRTAVRLGIQKGKTVVDDVPADAENAAFACPFRVERHTRTGKPNFLGPFAHGTPEERFIYLSWGEREGDAWNMFRRAKIDLTDIAWPAIEQAIATNRPLEATLRLTDRHGEPLCGTVTEEYIAWK